MNLAAMMRLVLEQVVQNVFHPLALNAPRTMDLGRRRQLFRRCRLAKRD
jgi:hypothetical protein